MLSRGLVCLAALACLSCATYPATPVLPRSETDAAASQTYRPLGSREMWRIGGEILSAFRADGSVDRTLRITINGKDVVRGGLSTLGEGTLTGTYRGRDVVSACTSTQRTPNWLVGHCVVTIDGEEAATLTF